MTLNAVERKKIYEEILKAIEQIFCDKFAINQALYTRRPAVDRLDVPNCLRMESLQTHFGDFFPTSEWLDVLIDRNSQGMFTKRMTTKNDDADCLIYFAREVPELWLRSYLTSIDLSHQLKYPNHAYEVYDELRDFFRNFCQETRTNQIRIISVIAEIKQSDEWNTYLNQLKNLVRRNEF